MTITTPIIAYSEIHHHPGAPFTLGGRVQELPSGYAIDRVLLTDLTDGITWFFVQCLDPVLHSGHVWGWVSKEHVDYGAIG